MVDDKRDDDDDGGDELVHVKRQPKNLTARKSLPSVESALDDFIISANQKPLDVKEFTPETREQDLRDEVAALKKKLADAEKREPAVAAASPPAATRSWGAIAGAFLVGGVLAFAAAKLTSSSGAPVIPAAPVECPPTSAPATAPIATAPTMPSDAAAPPPAVATRAPEPPPPPVSREPVKQPRGPKPPKEATGPAPVSPPKPAPARDGSGSDLYNPF